MRTRAAFTIVAALAFAAQVHAQGGETPLFADFIQFCVDTGAMPEAVKATVEAAGGTLHSPPGAASSPVPMMVTTWEHFRSNQRLTISAGTQHVPATDNSLAFDFHHCIATSFVNEDASMAAIRNWVGVPPDRNFGGLMFYSFLAVGSERLPVTDSSDRARSARSQDGEWNLLIIQHANGGSVQLSHVLPANP